MARILGRANHGSRLSAPGVLDDRSGAAYRSLTGRLRSSQQTHAGGSRWCAQIEVRINGKRNTGPPAPVDVRVSAAETDHKATIPSLQGCQFLFIADGMNRR